MTRDPHCRQKWIAMLAKLCCPMDAVTAGAALAAMLPMLEDLPDGAFTDRSLTHIARLATGVPSYAKLRAWLAEWWKDNKPAMPALPDNLAALTADERRWLAYWHQREREGFAPLREPDGRLSRPDVRDWRAHAASMVRRYAPRVLELVAA